MGELATEGATIRFDAEGDGELAVLVHGSWVDGSSWTLLRPMLASSLRTIGYDRRGHGASSGGGSLDDDVHDLAALVEAAGGGPAHLIGNSLGATICLRLAAQRPDLVRSACLHEPPLLALVADDPALAGGLEEMNRGIGEVLQRIGEGDHAGAAEQFVEMALGPGAWAALPEEERQRFVRHAPTFAEENAEPAIYAMEPEVLARVTAPILLTGGEGSPPHFAPILDRLELHLPHAVRETVPQAGHVPHASHPEDYARIIQRFFGQIAEVAG